MRYACHANGDDLVFAQERLGGFWSCNRLISRVRDLPR
jgi:hypothetical protein